MSGTNTQANVPAANESPDLPVAAIVCLSVGGYVLLVCAFLVIKRMLVAKGHCQSECCSGQGDTCCVYCAKLSQACPCCCATSPEGCLSTFCGKRKRIYCVDILLCNCCGCTEQLCEMS